MAATRPPADRDLRTVDDFMKLVPDGQKADLIDGVIYMASPDSPRANDLNAFLCALLRMFPIVFSFSIMGVRSQKVSPRRYSLTPE